MEFDFVTWSIWTVGVVIWVVWAYFSVEELREILEIYRGEMKNKENLFKQGEEKRG